MTRVRISRSQSRSETDLPALSSPEAKNFSLFHQVETAIERRDPVPDKEGRFAIVTNVGRGMRWTRAAHETKAPGRGRRSRVVLISRR
jgi:hypothetical protein